MGKDSGELASAASTRGTWGTRATRAIVWVGYLACGWAMIFAAVSFYWAAGGTLGSDTIGPALTSLAHDPVFVAILWSTGGLKVVVGLLALALVQSWGRVVPHWMLLTAAWVAFAIMALYEGAASWVQHGLMQIGAISTPSGLGTKALHWHLLLWDPWWLLGGILIGVLTWSYQRRSRAMKHSHL